LLIQAVLHVDEELKMPPKEKLPEEAIADLAAWVKRGAPDPRTEPGGAKEVHSAPARPHWAFLPPKDTPLPEVKRKDWVRNPLDAFILAKLEEEGFGPAPRADKRTLLRRATYDLIGLPPSWEEIEAFRADDSTDAFAKVVERLLASPHYGERWGRHWLDVARYADTTGRVDFGTANRDFDHSYTYRDWVIQALNEDLPYDQFVIRQIAADGLPLGQDRRALAALGFLTLGRRFLSNIHDIIDSGEDRGAFKEGSGRLKLAQAIASRENPLTAWLCWPVAPALRRPR
jgi:hypothetical protein